MYCGKHGRVTPKLINVHTQGDPRPPVTEMFCPKCMDDNNSKIYEKKRRDEIYKEVEAEDVQKRTVQFILDKLNDKGNE